MNAMTKRKAQHWIGGEWVSSPSERESIDPATGQAIGTFCDGGAEVAQAAIDAAAAAFHRESWATDPMQRTTALSHLADAYAARLGPLAAGHPGVRQPLRLVDGVVPGVEGFALTRGRIKEGEHQADRRVAGPGVRRLSARAVYPRPGSAARPKAPAVGQDAWPPRKPAA